MSRPSDKEMEASVARMLMVGVSLSALVVLAGGILLLRHPMVKAPSYTHFHAMAPSLRSIEGIASSAFHGSPGGLIQLGLLLLIATPVARVAFCVFGFLRQRNKLFTVVSSIVLAILLYSLSKGAH